MSETVEKTLTFESPRLLSELYCESTGNLTAVENLFHVKVVTRENWLQVKGSAEAVEKVSTLLQILRLGKEQGLKVRQGDFENLSRIVAADGGKELLKAYSEPLVLKLKKKSIVPKTINQKRYLAAIQNTDIVFGIGPAGTGKTYLAVASALDLLAKGTVEKLILTRPAVEAGEALGFLPGDLQEKIQPYLRPLYDALNEMLGDEFTKKFMERGILEIAPLAYMRGRTLSNACVILDEAQNTTPEQMMMFLTRLGDDSRMVITGDITQIDLPRHKYSGLKEVIDVLGKVKGIEFFFFDGMDVVRNPLVQRIIEAYKQHQERTGSHMHKSPFKSRNKAHAGMEHQDSLEEQGTDDDTAFALANPGMTNAFSAESSPNEPKLSQDPLVTPDPLGQSQSPKADNANG